MINIIATAESVEQAQALIDVGVDTLYIGNDDFGLRLPKSFTDKEIAEITTLAHEAGRKVVVAVNGLMHNEHIASITPYLQFLEAQNVDAITVGDPGVIHILNKEGIDIPFIYDAHTLVTSARQINFWVKRGAVGAVLARELTFTELEMIRQQVDVPLEILVYGATCIHQSKRPLVQNYFNFTKQDIDVSKERGLFLAEPKKPDTHYSIYEDKNGTHIFATDDVNLMLHLDKLYATNYKDWKLDGIFTRGERFVNIAELFVQAKAALTNGNWSEALAASLNEKLQTFHPPERSLDEGFFLKDPSEVQ